MRLISIPLIFIFIAHAAVAESCNSNRSVACLPVSIEYVEKKINAIKQSSPPEFENIFQASHKPVDDSATDARIKRKVRLANRLGLLSLIGFFVPVIDFLSLPTAIAAILIGHHTKKLTTDTDIQKEASKGMIAGWITIGLFLIATYLIIRLI